MGRSLRRDGTKRTAKGSRKNGKQDNQWASRVSEVTDTATGFVGYVCVCKDGKWTMEQATFTILDKRVFVDYNGEQDLP